MNKTCSEPDSGFGWCCGDPVIVQIPQGTGFSTFNGIVSGIRDDGQIEVCRSGRDGAIVCRPEWVYSEDCWMQ